MCTSFSYHSAESRLVAMNFDNDGKALKVASLQGGDLTFLVGMGKNFFPSFGVSATGVFVNDLMVDDTGAGKYLRQTEGRWTSTRLVQHLLEGALDAEGVAQVLARVEVVNTPGRCSHNLIVAPDSRAWVVEHGIRSLEASPPAHPSITLTNFPLSRYPEAQPSPVEGSGADRYTLVRQALGRAPGRLGVDEAFRILEMVRQEGPVWKTQLSLVYDLDAQTVFLSNDGSFRPTAEVRVGTGTLRPREGDEVRLSKAGIRWEAVSLSNPGNQP